MFDDATGNVVIENDIFSSTAFDQFLDAKGYTCFNATSDAGFEPVC